VILYCDSDLIEYLGSRVDYTIVNMSLSTVEMRRLNEPRGQSFRLIVSDDADILSRGIDFRGGAQGLTFL
jgi:hypothetical protein